MESINYGFTRKFGGIGFDDALAKTTDALKAGGFGVLTEIDVKATLKKKIDVDFRNYRILGACNPLLAHQALSGELGIGLLLPCNVIVLEEDDGSVTVSVAKPEAMFQIVENEALRPIMASVTEAIRKVVARLEEQGAVE